MSDDAKTKKAETPNDAIDFERLEKDALASMSPKERLGYELAKAQLAATQQANRIASATDRRGVASDAIVAERLRVVGETHEALAAGRRSASTRVEVPWTLEQVEGIPSVVVRCTAQGWIAGEGEEHAGEMMIGQLTGWDFSEVDAALWPDCLRFFQIGIDDATRAGQPNAARDIEARARGHQEREGLAFRRYWEVQRPLMARVVCHKPLSALVSAGVVRLPGDVEVSDTPIVLQIQHT